MSSGPHSRASALLVALWWVLGALALATYWDTNAVAAVQATEGMGRLRVTVVWLGVLLVSLVILILVRLGSLAISSGLPLITSQRPAGARVPEVLTGNSPAVLAGLALVAAIVIASAGWGGDTRASFLSTLIWQGILIAGFLALRTELRGLVNRLASFKVGGSEMAFHQAPAADPPGVEHVAPETRVGPGGFLTRSGVQDLIRTSDMLDPGEEVREALLLLRTEKQRTWLVTTTRSLFCILDDEATRESGVMIQWRLPLSHASSVRARHIDARGGTVDIGPRVSWLYSASLHPSAERLQKSIEDLLQRAAEA